MSAPIEVSVVVAVQHAQDNLPQIMAALAPSRHSGVEILVCHTDADPDVARRIVSSDNVRVIAGERASLAPHFWSDGIRAARGPAVALITAHCIPDADWIVVQRSGTKGNTDGPVRLAWRDPGAGSCSLHRPRSARCSLPRSWREQRLRGAAGSASRRRCPGSSFS